MRSVLLAIPFLFLASTTVPSIAAVTTYAGKAETTVDISRTYTISVPEHIAQVKFAVPMFTNLTEFGCSFLPGSATVTESLPPTAEQSDVQGRFGDTYHVVSYDNPPPGDITITVVNTGVKSSFDLGSPLPKAPFPVTADDSVSAYLLPSKNEQSDDDAIAALAKKLTANCTSESAAAEAITKWVAINVSYDMDEYHSGDITNKTATDVLGSGKAVCNGYSHIFVALARAAGIPCRFVKGYIVQPQPDFPGSVSSTTEPPCLDGHAWVEVWFPGAGWVPYEPQGTAGFVNSHHLFIASGPDDSDFASVLSSQAYVMRQVSADGSMPTEPVEPDADTPRCHFKETDHSYSNIQNEMDVKIIDQTEAVIKQNLMRRPSYSDSPATPGAAG